ncbi:hypothetical protein E2C01_026829 [Portunus trituberculatus]|uniref:Uncharacterized protein n=1 Tax=Portunus trituberculatus TaxID=210409 RepID=A0A5B7EK12_PORTR|nr:hypothetical protein [Portunus trituberculatus]
MSSASFCEPRLGAQTPGDARHEHIVNIDLCFHGDAVLAVLVVFRWGGVSSVRTVGAVRADCRALDGGLSTSNSDDWYYFCMGKQR